MARSRAVKRARTEELLREALREGSEAGLGEDELIDIAKELLKEKE